MNDSAVKERFALSELPYAYDALAPDLSEETLRYHHDKHHAAYVAKLNELVAGTSFEGRTLEEIVRTADGPLFNNAAQAWNHTFYFEQFASAPAPLTEGALRQAVDRDFGSFEAMRDSVLAACAALFGSGWVWLVSNDGVTLSLRSAPNAGNPLREGLQPLLTLDVWEHAYYIDYRNRRPDAVAAHWQRIDWRKVAERYACIGNRK